MKLHVRIARLQIAVMALLFVVVTAGPFMAAASAPALQSPTCDPNAPITRVSVSSDGVQSDSGSASPSISGDGRYVVFSSSATTLVSGDTAIPDVYLHDRQTCQTTRISVAPDGSGGDSNSFMPAISLDGNVIVFSSLASNLVTGDTNGQADVYAFNRQTGEMQLVTIAFDGALSNGRSENVAVSYDGQRIVFESAATNLVSGDNNGVTDIFVHDLQTGLTRRVSVSSGGTQGNKQSKKPAISADGRWVAFWSDATNLVSDDTNNRRDVFSHDVETGTTFRVSVASGGTQSNGWPNNFPSLSGDGLLVAFDSDASDLVSDDTNGLTDLFMHDRQTWQTTKVITSVEPNAAAGSPLFSQSGRYITFGSAASNLVSGDSGNTGDIFVYDRETGEITRVSNGSSGMTIYYAFSADGSTVTFVSAASDLVSGDTNGQWDVFVARVLFSNAAQSGPTFTVNTTDDVNDGTCTYGHCSLREAVIAANAAPGITINIPAGIYTLGIPGFGEDAALTGDLDITANMTISGAGEASTIIDGGAIDRVFDVHSGVQVNLNDLTVRNGQPRSDERGGGIANTGTLSLSHVTVSGNTAPFDGGISSSGSLILEYSSVSNNRGNGGIGGLNNSEGGTAVIQDSLINNNIGAVAAGLANDGGLMTIVRSTISNNTATSDGGGIHNFGQMQISDTTISGNVAIHGSGIYSALSTASLRLENSTVVGNIVEIPPDAEPGTLPGGSIFVGDSVAAIINSTIADNTGDGIVSGQSNGGATTVSFVTLTGNSGHAVYNYLGTLTMKAVVVAEHSSGNCAVDGSSITSDGHNLSDDTSCVGFFNTGTDQNSVNPLLDSLQDNGGHTPTCALQPGSPAINVVPAGQCTVTADQRGVARPVGGGCDSGAYELEYSAPKPTLLQPGNNSITSSRLPTFQWGSISGATGYELSLGRNNPPQAVITVNSTTYTPPTPLLYDSYFWHVRVLGSGDDGWSETWSVTIAAPLNAVPERNLFTTGRPTLTWSPITWAVRYEIQISSDSAFGTAAVYDRRADVGGNVLEYTIPDVEDALPDGVYYWRVRAKNARGVSGYWSAADRFVVDMP